MATKTISIDLEAYERLATARTGPKESFSRVIKRAHWQPEASTGAALLEVLAGSAPPGKRALARLEAAQKADAPPARRWTSRKTPRS